jgi:hypothetical protein
MMLTILGIALALRLETPDFKSRSWMRASFNSVSVTPESDGTDKPQELWPGQKAARVPCVPPYCHFLCEQQPEATSCTPPPREPVRGRTCETSSGERVTIYPIQFGVPEQDVVACVPAKSRAFATIEPGNLSTYIFEADDEPEYKRDYRKSYFALTKRKAGWDCMRHYEILASGSLPFFPGLEASPVGVMTFLPKELLLKARSMPGKLDAFKSQTFAPLLYSHDRV